MTNDTPRDTLRTVSLRRTQAGQFIATNARGIELRIGGEHNFSPVELLLAALAGCTGADVDALTSRRSEPERFEVEARGDKIRDESGNRMENLEVVFRVRFPDDVGGDAARAVLPEMVAKSHDRLCTVSRTVEVPTPIKTLIE
ncbi:MAG TPA: OsmC family protein [Jiangellaceae bacterium]